MKKKRFQKLFSFLLACMLMVSMMTIEASAAPNDTTGLDPEIKEGSLTLQENVKGKKSTYTAYQVLNATIVEGQDTYAYELTEKFKGAGVTVEEISKANGSPNYEINDSLDTIAATLENYVKITQGITGTTLNVGSATTLPIGYYLILETATTSGFKQTKPMLVAIPGTNSETGAYVYNVTVTIKDQPITTTKTIKEAEGAIKDSIAQQVGKVFTFKIVQDVPKYDVTYKNIVFNVTDTMSKGLEFIEDSVKVYADTNLLNADQYGFTKGNGTEEGTTVLTFNFSENNENPNYYQNVKDAKQVIIEYEAKLTKDAVFGPSGELNTVVPEFGEKPGSTTTGTPDKAKAFAGGLEITKKGENNAALQGAEFTVYEDERCEKPAQLVTYTVNSEGIITTEKTPALSPTATTDKNGVVRFEGLGAGTYWIKETKAPAGYIKLEKPIKVEVKVTLPNAITTGEETAEFEYTVSGNGITGDKVITNNGIVKFEVQNTKGFTLPTTGGMGTYIFTIGGVLLIAAAVVLFIRSRKKAD